MSGEKHYSVYILANPPRTPDTARTNNLRRRLDEHKRKLVPGFTARYNINRLVYFEVFEDVRNGSIVRRKSNLGPEQNESRQSSPKSQVGRFKSRLGSAPDISSRLVGIVSACGQEPDPPLGM